MSVKTLWSCFGFAWIFSWAWTNVCGVGPAANGIGMFVGGIMMFAVLLVMESRQ